MARTGNDHAIQDWNFVTVCLPIAAALFRRLPTRSFSIGVMMRYLCIHGHFYQPPRENPSLEAIELQDSAYPYHDWNERITAECYAPNGTSRLLDDQQRIVKLVNNYGQISFNFGPTLLLWMEQKSPEVLESIKQADKESQERFGGHGSAMA